MSDRVSQTVLLCEDQLHERIVKAYMKECGLPTHAPYVRPHVASQEQQGGNDAWVLNQFPIQVRACRQRQKKATTLLIVVIDADRFTVVDRRRQLNDRLKEAGYEELSVDDPVVLLIPRRHGETWICSLLGETVTEDEDCKDWENPSKEEIRQAARTAYEWARPNATPGPTCVPSLQVALPEWRKIG
jgi:hypothetical protein